MPIVYMLCGGISGLLAGGLALMAGMGFWFALAAYCLVGAVAIGLISWRVSASA